MSIWATLITRENITTRKFGESLSLCWKSWEWCQSNWSLCNQKSLLSPGKLRNFLKKNQPLPIWAWFTAMQQSWAAHHHQRHHRHKHHNWDSRINRHNKKLVDELPQPKFDPISGLGPTFLPKQWFAWIKILKTPKYLLQITIGITWNAYCIFMINTTAIHTLLCWPP